MLSIGVSEFRATMNAVLQKVREGNFWSLVLLFSMSIHGHLAHRAMTDA
jgi:hypothetical protein